MKPNRGRRVLLENLFCVQLCGLSSFRSATKSERELTAVVDGSGEHGVDHTRESALCVLQIALEHEPHHVQLDVLRLVSRLLLR